MGDDHATEDQRFAAQRPDVLTYRTEAFEEDFVIAGPITVDLTVSTSGTDSDFVVKLIDVYPGDYPQPVVPAGTSVDIPKARPEQFQKATQRVYRGARGHSSITVLVECGALPARPDSARSK